MIDSQQGSCSKGAQGILKELDVSGCVKKKLDLVEDQNVDEKNEKVEDVVLIGGGDNEIEILLEKSVKDDLGCSEWLLAVGNTSNGVKKNGAKKMKNVKDCVDAIKIYKDKAKKMLKKKIIWENLAGVPVQNGSKDCGIYVMLYMKEICEDRELDFCSKWLRRGNNTFNDDDVNDIKNSWAKFFLKHHT
ncbi:hypothetical protein ACET3Z_028330 [Daucus carota]